MLVDHPHDLHDLRRGDPQTALELAPKAEPAKHRRDLRTAAVHDDWTQTCIPEERDVLSEGELEGVVDHGVAAVLDDDQGAAEALQPGQRLDEGLRLGGGNPKGSGVDDAPDRGRPGAGSGHVL